jgi:hypothetical protein
MSGHDLLFMNIEPFKTLNHRAILSTDDNPMYLGFWPLVARAWTRIVGIKPTLALVADDDVEVDETLGDVIRFKPIPGVSTSLQAQAIRLLLPTYYRDDVCLISDIDMLPLNREYYLDSIRHVASDNLVVYRDAAYGPTVKRYPMCYVAATGATFREVFDSIDEIGISEKLREWDQLHYGWYTDEYLLYRYASAWESNTNRCVKLGHAVDRRIDRSQWYYDEKLVRDGYYIDAHMIRPYHRYKHELDALGDLLGLA